MGSPGAVLRAGRELLHLKPHEVTAETRIRETYIYALERNSETMPEVFSAYVGFLSDRLGDAWAAEMAQSVFESLATQAAGSRGRDQLRLAQQAHWGMLGTPSKARKKAEVTPPRSLVDMQAVGAISSVDQSAPLLRERSRVRLADGAHPTRGGKTTVKSPGGILELAALFSNPARKPHTRFALGA